MGFTLCEVYSSVKHSISSILTVATSFDAEASVQISKMQHMIEEEKIPRKEVVAYYKFQVNTTDALINIKKPLINRSIFFFSKYFYQL